MRFQNILPGRLFDDKIVKALSFELPRAANRQISTALGLGGDSDRAYIISGFRVSHDTSELTITAGSALMKTLGDNGIEGPYLLDFVGEPDKTYDLSGYADGTYIVYITTHIEPASYAPTAYYEAVPDTEVIYSKAQELAENWSAIITQTTPAEQYLAVGQCTILSGVITESSNLDNNLLFDQQGLISDSTWGDANDRTGVTKLFSLRRFVHAMQKQLQGITGSFWYTTPATSLLETARNALDRAGTVASFSSPVLTVPSNHTGFALTEGATVTFYLASDLYPIDVVGDTVDASPKTTIALELSVDPAVDSPTTSKTLFDATGKVVYPAQLHTRVRYRAIYSASADAWYLDTMLPGIKLTSPGVVIHQSGTFVRRSEGSATSTYNLSDTFCATPGHWVKVMNDHATDNVQVVNGAFGSVEVKPKTTAIITMVGALGSTQYNVAKYANEYALIGKVVEVSSTATLDRDTTTALLDTSGGGYTVTLPAQYRDGQVLILKKVTSDATAFSITTGTSGTIDGTTTRAFALAWASIALVRWGDDWFILQSAETHLSGH